MTEWHAAEDRNNREKIDRARQAAEALFRPARDGDSDRAPPPVTANSTESTEQQIRRQPRIFTVPPRLPAAAEGETMGEPTGEPKPVRRKPAQRRTDRIPPSQIGRVRALTTYGMTLAQVAELYGVTVEAIERVLGRPADTGKSR